MRPNIADIIVNELQAEHDEIEDYRYAVASGIDGNYHSVLDDYELSKALEKVIEYYKTKIDTHVPNTDSPNDVYVNTDLGDINLMDFDSDDAYYNAVQDGFDSKWTPNDSRD